MLGTTETTSISKELTNQVSVNTTDETGATVAKPVINLRATFNSTGATFLITGTPLNLSLLTDPANNAQTQADVQTFIQEVFTALGDAGLTYYGAPSANS